MDLAGCGYATRARLDRAERMEWEHIVPASWLGNQLQCWQNGGRKNCQATDPRFARMEADLFNLYPSVGEVNADRSDYAASVLPATDPYAYGQCRTRVDFKSRIMDPQPSARGLVARTHFYMADRYHLRLSQQQQRVLMVWDRQYPPTAWELERDRRIARLMGTSNPFTTRQKVWGATPSSPVSAPVAVSPPPVMRPAPQDAGLPAVLGNRNSGIFHVRGHCPGYEKISPQNRVAFPDEASALRAGFRRAGNCR
jgi:deoxyribonuclease-1